MRVAVIVSFLVAIFGLASAQLNLPEMPGPPYPDKFGNNRWGVKYDPRVHGRGRSPHGAPSSSAGVWGGDGGEPQYSPGPRSPPPSRSKWTSALRPLVSRHPLLSKLKGKRNRRPSGPKSSPFDPTSDSFYKNPYTSKAIDGYVKNYLNTYNEVAQTPSISSADLINIENFARPTNRNGRSRSRNFARNGNRRSLVGTSESSFSNTSSLTDSYNIAAGLSDNDEQAIYRTLNPQSDFFGPKITKKKSDFAKTLSSFYNDYKPGGENADSGISTNSGNSESTTSSSISGISAAATDSHSDTVARDDDYPPSYSALPPPPPPPPRRNRPRPPPPSFSDGPSFVERPYYSSGSSRPRGRPFSSRGPPPSSYSSGPLSSLDIFDDIPSYSSRRPPSRGLYDDFDSPMIITTSDDDPSFGSSFGPGSFSSLGPVRTSSYSMSGPPPSSSLYSSSLDSFGLSGPGHFSSPLSMSGPPPRPNNRPFTPPLGAPPAPPPLAIAPAPVAPISYLPASSLYYPPALIPLTKPSSKPDDDKPKKKHKIKRKKKRLQHTPMNVLRGLLGRGERRDRYREQRDREREDDAPDRDHDSYKPAYAVHYPVALPAPVAPPQYTYNPAVNTLTGPSPLNYSPAPAQPAYQPPPPAYPAAPPAYPAAPSAYPAGVPQQSTSPLLSGIATLRDTITSIRGHRHPPPPPPQITYITYNDRSRERERERKREHKKEGPPPPHPPPSPSPGPITQHLQDWPRIFTAMGASADAVFGGIHGVRKEISKMTGHTMAKGILMSGTAVHEVTKGVAHVITKMSAL